MPVTTAALDQSFHRGGLLSIQLQSARLLQQTAAPWQCRCEQLQLHVSAF